MIAEVTLRCVPAFTLRGVDAPRAAGGDARRASTSWRAATTTSSSSSSRTPTSALTRTNNRIDEPPRPRGRARARTPTTCCSTNHAFGAALPRRRGAARARSRSSTGCVTRLGGRTRARRPLGGDLRQPRAWCASPRWSTRCRASTRRAVRRGAGDDRAARLRRAVPDRGAQVAPDDAFLSTATGATAASSPCTCSRGCRGTVLPRRRGDHGRAGGRPHWGKRHFQTAATLRSRYPDWDRFQAVRERLDPQAASPTTGATACWARSPGGYGDAPEQAYSRLERATAGLQAPFALVDLDALRANAEDLERRAAATPIRLASKSLRCARCRSGFSRAAAFRARWPSAAGGAVAGLARDRRHPRCLPDGRRDRAGRLAQRSQFAAEGSR